MISAAVIAAGMLASCSNKEIVDEQTGFQPPY